MLLFTLLAFLLLTPEPPQAQSDLRQGLQALQQGHLPEARSTLEKASKEDPGDAYIWSSLAEVYGRLGEKQLAYSAAETALKLQPQNPVICHALALFFAQAGDFARAATLEQIFAASPRATPDAWLRAAQFYLQAGDDAAASAIAAQHTTGDPALAFEWAQSLLRRQDFSSASDFLSKALQEHPNDAQLTLALGVAQYGQRRFGDAIATFLQVTRIDPTVEQPYQFLGKMLDQAGPHLPEIVQADEKWLAAHPNDARASLELAKALLQSHADDPRAEKLLRDSIATDGSNWESHYQLGALLADHRQFAQAAEELKRATELDPKQAIPHYRLARVYDRLGQPEKAADERRLHQELIAGTPAK